MTKGELDCAILAHADIFGFHAEVGAFAVSVVLAKWIDVKAPPFFKYFRCRQQSGRMEVQMKKKLIIGPIFGLLVGLLHALVTIMVKDPIFVSIAVLVLWGVIGYILAMVQIKVPSAVKGIIVAVPMALPLCIINIPHLPVPFIILAIAIVLGAILGVLIENLGPSNTEIPKGSTYKG